MGLPGLLFYGLVHMAMFPVLVVISFFLWILDYSKFNGIRRFRTAQNTVGGTLSPQFLPVLDMVKGYVKEGSTLGLQYYASVNGVHVVDIWGRVDNQIMTMCDNGYDHRTKVSPYDGESVQMIWSATKIVTAVAIAIACDRKWMAYTDPVDKFWPAFSAKHKDKSRVTIADLLRHEAGLWTMNEKVHLSLAFEKETLRQRLADEPLHDYGKRFYHMVTSGEVLEVVLTAADPKKRSLAVFIKEEIAAPLQLRSLMVGLDNALEKTSVRMARSTMGSDWALRVTYATTFACICVLFTVLSPLLLLPIKISGTPLRSWASKWSDLTRCLGYGDKDTFAAKSFCFAGFKTMWNAREISATPRIAEMEMGAASGVSSARDLGKMGAMLANWGELNGVRVMSEEGVKAMFDHPVDAMMKGIGVIPTSFTQGGMDKRGYGSKPAGEYDAVFGWAGWGGTIMLVNPHYRVASAFCTNAMTWDINKSIFLTVKAAKIASQLHKAGKAPDAPCQVAELMGNQKQGTKSSAKVMPVDGDVLHQVADAV